MLYTIQIIVYSILLYGVYVSLLKGKPNHSINRYFLLCTAVIPLVLPLLKFRQFSSKGNVITEMIQVRLPEITIINKGNEMGIANINNALMIVYVTIAIGLLIHFSYQWLRFMKKLKSFQQKQYGDQTILINTQIGPASFGKYIILPNEEMNEAILEHEMAHINLKHTNELFFISVLRCIFWFNPILFFIQKELKIVHEFEADSHVSIATFEYQKLLLAQVFNKYTIPFIHSFNQHPLKRRIMMLNKNKKKNVWSYITATSIVLLLIGNIIGVQSADAKKWTLIKDNNPLSPSHENNVSHQLSSIPDSTVYQFVDKMPEPKVDIADFLAQHLEYPIEARKKKIEGRVVIKFIVNKEGKMVDFVEVKSPEKMLTEEAMRVLKLMPDWTPGENEQGERVNVVFTLPIQFKLD